MVRFADNQPMLLATNASALILQPGTVTNTVSNLAAPPGTAYVRYQVVFAQGPDNANGSMYFDDMTLNQTGDAIPGTQWNIVWSDEFNGTSINSNNWTFDTGNNYGWGNQEREYYTSNTNNAYVDGTGFLHIAALQQSMGGFNFTSARMKSEGFYSTPTYGRFQWRAALPAGSGMWPALWMMGANEPTVGWPACGEMDVMENNGDNTAFVQGSLHYGTTRQIQPTRRPFTIFPVENRQPISTFTSWIGPPPQFSGWWTVIFMKPRTIRRFCLSTSHSFSL